MAETEEKTSKTKLQCFKKRSMKHQIQRGVRVSVSANDVEELRAILGEDRWEMLDNNNLNLCVVCEEQCTEGELAIEDVLFIPNKNDPSCESFVRFTVEQPRVCCHECAVDNSQRSTPLMTSTTRSIGQAFKDYEDKKSQDTTRPTNVLKSEENNNTNVNSGNENQQSVIPTEAEKDPFDDGFLICTQLVKTGGADQGGLQVGDVFVEFAHYSKKRFPGLKSIANLVRRSAEKEIPVVVWRKLEVNSMEDNAGRTVFQKLALKLKPLRSHDADGGGVLGSVINTYPLPEMKN